MDFLCRKFASFYKIFQIFIFVYWLKFYSAHSTTSKENRDLQSHPKQWVSDIISSFSVLSTTAGGRSRRPTMKPVESVSPTNTPSTAYYYNSASGDKADDDQVDDNINDDHTVPIGTPTSIPSGNPTPIPTRKSPVADPTPSPISPQPTTAMPVKKKSKPTTLPTTSSNTDDDKNDDDYFDGLLHDFDDDYNTDDNTNFDDNNYYNPTPSPSLSPVQIINSPTLKPKRLRIKPSLYPTSEPTGAFNDDNSYAYNSNGNGNGNDDKIDDNGNDDDDDQSYFPTGLPTSLPSTPIGDKSPVVNQPVVSPSPSTSMTSDVPSSPTSKPSRVSRTHAPSLSTDSLDHDVDGDDDGSNSYDDDEEEEETRVISSIPPESKVSFGEVVAATFIRTTAIVLILAVVGYAIQQNLDVLSKIRARLQGRETVYHEVEIEMENPIRH